jgi:hypothetical protein
LTPATDGVTFTEIVAVPVLPPPVSCIAENAVFAFAAVPVNVMVGPLKEVYP